VFKAGRKTKNKQREISLCSGDAMIEVR